MRTFFTLYYLLISSDIIAAFMGAIAIWDLRKSDILSGRLSVLFIALIAGRVCEYIASTYSPIHHIDGNYTLIFYSLLGKTLVSLAIWWLVIMIVKVHKEVKNGNH